MQVHTTLESSSAVVSTLSSPNAAVHLRTCATTTSTTPALTAATTTTTTANVTTAPRYLYDNRRHTEPNFILGVELISCFGRFLACPATLIARAHSYFVRFYCNDELAQYYHKLDLFRLVITMTFIAAKMDECKISPNVFRTAADATLKMFALQYYLQKQPKNSRYPEYTRECLQSLTLQLQANPIDSRRKPESQLNILFSQFPSLPFLSEEALISRHGEFKSKLLETEMIVLKELKFQLECPFPHTFALQLINTIWNSDLETAPKEENISIEIEHQDPRLFLPYLKQQAWNICNDFMKSRLILQYNASQVAVFAIHCADLFLCNLIDSESSMLSHNWWNKFGLHEDDISKAQNVLSDLYSQFDALYTPTTDSAGDAADDILYVIIHEIITYWPRI